MTEREKSTGEYRKFGLALTLAFTLVGSLLLWRGHPTGTAVFYSFGAINLIITLISPNTMRYPIKLFMAVGSFNTKLILVITYFLVMTPVGIFMRLIGKDTLDRKFKVDKPSYWLNRDETDYTPKHIEKPF